MAEEKKNPLIGAFRSPPPKEAAKAPPDANVWDVTGALTLCGRYEKIITII